MNFKHYFLACSFLITFVDTGCMYEQKARCENEDSAQSSLSDSLVIIPGQVPSRSELSLDGNSPFSTPGSSPRNDSHLNDVDIVSSYYSVTPPYAEASQSSAPNSSSHQRDLTPAERSKRSEFIRILKTRVLVETNRQAFLANNQANQDDVPGEYIKFLDSFADKMADLAETYDADLRRLGLAYFLPVRMRSSAMKLYMLKAHVKLTASCVGLARNETNRSVQWAAQRIQTDAEMVAACAIETFSKPPTFSSALLHADRSTKTILGVTAVAIIAIPVAFIAQKLTRKAVTE